LNAVLKTRRWEKGSESASTCSVRAWEQTKAPATLQFTSQVEDIVHFDFDRFLFVASDLGKTQGWNNENHDFKASQSTRVSRIRGVRSRARTGGFVRRQRGQPDARQCRRPECCPGQGCNNMGHREAVLGYDLKE
jgi:hypothetical protein